MHCTYTTKGHCPGPCIVPCSKVLHKFMLVQDNDSLKPNKKNHHFSKCNSFHFIVTTRNILDCDQSNVLLAHYFQFSAKFLKFWRRIWLTSFNNSALKTFARRKYLGYISDTSRVIANFGSKFVAMATRVGRDRIWLTSLNRPTRKPPVGRKNLGDISHISRVIANFSSNFVAMATRVGRGRIWLTPLMYGFRGWPIQWGHLNLPQADPCSEL